MGDDRWPPEHNFEGLGDIMMNDYAGADPNTMYSKFQVGFGAQNFDYSTFRGVQQSDLAANRGEVVWYENDIDLYSLDALKEFVGVCERLADHKCDSSSYNEEL